MKYTLFDDFITLQALLKELGIIKSGGAVKGYLAETAVLFNGEDEKRRGKKLRVGDVITIPHDALEIEIVEPTPAEKEEHQQEMAEKKRVADLVKTLNKQAKTKTKKDQPKHNKTRKPVRFPGT